MHPKVPPRKKTQSEIAEIIYQKKTLDSLEVKP